MKRLFLAALFILIAVPGCPTQYVKPHPTPIVTDSAFCKPAEVHLKELNCIPNDKPYTKRGKQYEQFCMETQENGIFLNPKCISEIKTCEEVDICTGTKGAK